jgi:hypothetical protein
MDGAYGVSLYNEINTRANDPGDLINTAVGGSTMDEVLARVQDAANSELLPRTTIFWDGGANGEPSLAAYVDFLQDAITELGHDRFLVIPPYNIFGKTYVGSIREAISDEFILRWPNNFLHWKDFVVNTNGDIDASMYYDSANDTIHMSQAAADLMADAIIDRLSAAG